MKHDRWHTWHTSDRGTVQCCWWGRQRDTAWGGGGRGQSEAAHYPPPRPATHPALTPSNHIKPLTIFSILQARTVQLISVFNRRYQYIAERASPLHFMRKQLVKFSFKWYRYYYLRRERTGGVRHTWKWRSERFGKHSSRNFALKVVSNLKQAILCKMSDFFERVYKIDNTIQTCAKPARTKLKPFVCYIWKFHEYLSLLSMQKLQFLACLKNEAVKHRLI